MTIELSGVPALTMLAFGGVALLAFAAFGNFRNPTKIGRILGAVLGVGVLVAAYVTYSQSQALKQAQTQLQHTPCPTEVTQKQQSPKSTSSQPNPRIIQVIRVGGTY